MPQIENCSKCKSDKIIPRARIIDHSESVNDHLTVHVYENPEALFFKGTKWAILHARICGECGFVETYIDNHEELYSAYLKAEARQEDERIKLNIN